MPAIRYLAGKDNLHKRMMFAKMHWGEAPFAFWPRGFSLEIPQQFEAFRKIYENLKPEDQAPIYIIKRPGLARGQGVHLVGSLADVDYLRNSASPCHPLNKTRPIAQEYIKDVYLIEGHKITLRVYVMIASLDPLRVYVFPNGLVRICSRKYSTELESLSDVFVHVDSIDINDANEQEFVKEMEHSSIEHEGLRVQITTLLKMMTEQGLNGTKVWQDVQHACLMAILGAEEPMFKEYMDSAVVNRTRRITPYEMTGYDVLVDQRGKVYILEINNTPSMAPHTVMENGIKKQLLHDVFDLVDIENRQYNLQAKITNDKWKKVQKRQESGDTILNGPTGLFNLDWIFTKEDMWAIVETDLENARRGNFDRVFPVPGGEKYLEFIYNARNEIILRWINAGVTLDDIQ